MKELEDYNIQLPFLLEENIFMVVIKKPPPAVFQESVSLKKMFSRLIGIRCAVPCDLGVTMVITLFR